MPLQPRLWRCSILERIFQLRANATSVRTELLAGLTTFLTMSYIIFVQPAVLSGSMFGLDTGLPFGALTTATCLSAALATALMGLWARYPIALAPGMGENFFFVFSVLPAAAAAGYSEPWQAALGVVFVSGVLFLLISLSGARELMINAVSPSMKSGMAVGIGLFIAFIGLQNATLIVKDPATAVGLNPNLLSPDLMIFSFGLLVTAILQARGAWGAILWGILGATFVAWAGNLFLTYLPASWLEADSLKASLLLTRFSVAENLMAAPPSLAPVLFKMDLAAAFSLSLLAFVLVFLLMDVFDTLGSVIAIGEQAGFIKDNRLPRANRVLLADSLGTVAGAAMGTSTVTSFIESNAGIAVGGRTGLTSLTVAVLFVLALFFSPIVAMIGSYPPATAPALVVVGSMMMQNVQKIDWHDASEALPAFLMIVGIPLSYSISDGLALGFVSYPIVKFFAGKGREVPALMYALAFLLLLYFVTLRQSVG